jgi:hypothetical protein
MVLVKFKRDILPYGAGETASFDKQTADDFVARGAAEIIEEIAEQPAAPDEEVRLEVSPVEPTVVPPVEGQGTLDLTDPPKEV